MRKGFYLKLALRNVRNSREVFIPQMIAYAVMGGVFFLINGLIFSKGLTNMTSGNTAKMVFSMGIALFAIFAFFFMFYINGFLVKRRKREFGLYSVLGLSKRHIGKVLVWENLLVSMSGLVTGVLFGLALGRLMFLLLMKLIRSAPDSSFIISPYAYLVTFGLFAMIFACTTIYDYVIVSIANPIALMNTEKKGERDGRWLIPTAIVGATLLFIAYWYAWNIVNPGIAAGVFFLLALLVIIATFALFKAGSIVALRLLRANKRFYYKPDNFVTVSGLIHRMRQNARGLASICILSTMLLVTVSGTTSLYLAQEDMLQGIYPYDVEAWIKPEEAGEFLQNAEKLASELGVTLSADASKLVYETDSEPVDEIVTRGNYVRKDSSVTVFKNAVLVNRTLLFDVHGSEEACLSFGEALNVSNIFVARQEGYGLYGALLFLGVFFGILFLAVTVLIIYFKQITEGYEDKDRFEIMQKVGMDEARVKSTINRQMLLVFFLPLFTTLLHMLFASRIMTRMLSVFMLTDWKLVINCTLVASLIFAFMYLIVYRLTARAYLKIVKRE